MRHSSDETYETIGEESQITSYVIQKPLPLAGSQDIEKPRKRTSQGFDGPSESATSSGSSSSQDLVTPFSTSQDFEIPRLPELRMVQPIERGSSEIFEPPSPAPIKKSGLSQFGIQDPKTTIKEVIKEEFKRNMSLDLVKHASQEPANYYPVALREILRNWLIKHDSPSCEMTYSILNLIHTQNTTQYATMLERALLYSDNNRVLPMLQFGFISNISLDSATGKPKSLNVLEKDDTNWNKIAGEIHAFRIMSSCASIGDITRFIKEHQNSTKLNYRYNNTRHRVTNIAIIRNTIETMTDQFFDSRGILYLISLVVGGSSEMTNRVHRLCSCGDNLLETLKFMYESKKQDITRLEFTEKFRDKILELCGYNALQFDNIKRGLHEAQKQLSK